MQRWGERSFGNRLFLVVAGGPLALLAASLVVGFIGNPTADGHRLGLQAGAVLPYLLAFAVLLGLLFVAGLAVDRLVRAIRN